MREGIPSIKNAESVHVLLFPEYDASRDNHDLLVEWHAIGEIREAVLKALEEIRQAGVIGNSLEAKVRIKADAATASLLQRHESDLRYVFIVSQVAVEESPEALENPKIEVLKADGQKCERCWNYSIEVGQDAQYPTLCERCLPVVREINGIG